MSSLQPYYGYQRHNNYNNNLFHEDTTDSSSTSGSNSDMSGGEDYSFLDHSANMSLGSPQTPPDKTKHDSFLGSPLPGDKENAGPFSFQSPPRKACPPAPLKKRPLDVHNQDITPTTPIKNWQIVLANAERAGESTQVYKGTRFTAVSIPNATGCYMQACTVSADQQVVEGVQNEKLIYKKFLPSALERHAKLIDSYIRNSIAQYNQLRALQERLPIRIVTIYNSDTVKQDGFYLVEKINKAFPITWDKSTRLDQLDRESKSRLDDLKTMFKFAFENNINIDLSASNVRIDDEGNVVLIDFREDLDDDFYIHIPQLLRTFSNGNTSVFDHLNPIPVELRV